MPRASDLVRRKGESGQGRVIGVAPEATVLNAAEIMNNERIGSLVVLDGKGKLLGIFSERDVLRRVVAARQDPAKTRVGDVMTREVSTCPPETPLAGLRALMSERRIRHVPVVEKGRVVGMVSIGDLNAAEARELAETIVYLERYMTVS